MLSFEHFPTTFTIYVKYHSYFDSRVTCAYCVFLDIAQFYTIFKRSKAVIRLKNRMEKIYKTDKQSGRVWSVL